MLSRWVLGAVRAEFADHGKVVEKLRNQLGAATNTIDALGTRTRVMNRKLRDVEMLSDGTAPQVLGLTVELPTEAENDE
jgi:DNA recombination protein RmuC